MTTISLRLPDELAAEVEKAAGAQRKSRSQFFREAVVQKLASSGRRKKPSLFDLTSDLCGKGESGIGDLSSHPKHLEGYGA